MFPNAVTVLRAVESDEYGNPGNNWTTPAATPAAAMVLGEAAFMPPTVDIRHGDRVQFGAELFTVESVLRPGPGRAIVLAVTMKRYPDGA